LAQAGGIALSRVSQHAGYAGYAVGVQPAGGMAKAGPFAPEHDVDARQPNG